MTKIKEHTRSWFRLAICLSFIAISSCIDRDVYGSDEPLSSDQKVIEVHNAILKALELTTISSEASGKLTRVEVKEGIQVEENQVLAKVSDELVRLQLEEAKIKAGVSKMKSESPIDLDLANKRFQVATVELERARSANERVPNTYSVKEIDRLQLVADTARLEIDRVRLDQELSKFDVSSSENEYRQVQEMLRRYEVKSPTRGTVVTVHKKLGEWVEPGKELFQIINIDRLRIEGFVEVASLDRNISGQQAKVTVITGKGEKGIEGRVVFVSPDANPVNGQVRVHLEIENRQHLFRPGMHVRATIE